MSNDVAYRSKSLFSFSLRQNLKQTRFIFQTATATRAAIGTNKNFVLFIDLVRHFTIYITLPNLHNIVRASGQVEPILFPSYRGLRHFLSEFFSFYAFLGRSGRASFCFGDRFASE